MSQKNKYISVILAFFVCFIKLVTSAVGISLPLIFCIIPCPTNMVRGEKKISLNHAARFRDFNKTIISLVLRLNTR